MKGEIGVRNIKEKFSRIMRELMAITVLIMVWIYNKKTYYRIRMVRMVGEGET